MSIFGLDEEVRRVYGVHIASIELRAESKVSKGENQDSDAPLFAPSSSLYALYMGLGV